MQPPFKQYLQIVVKFNKEFINLESNQVAVTNSNKANVLKKVRSSAKEFKDAAQGTTS